MEGEKIMIDKLRIIIADDFQTLRDNLKELINKQEDMMVVGEASTGKEALEIAEKIDFDIVLMDIEMEKNNSGIIATEKIREVKPDAKIIFLSVHEAKDVILTAIGAGAIDYVLKDTGEDIIYHIRMAAKGEPTMQGKIQNLVMEEYMRLQKSEKSLLFFIKNVSKLTGTERELIKLLLQGLKIIEIAHIRCVEMSTIKTQIKGLLRKFGCVRTKEIVKMIEDYNLSKLFLD